MNTLNQTMIIAASILMLATPTLQAAPSPEKMEAAGYFCFEAGPSNWTHCLRLNLLGKGNAVPVLVFSVDQDTSEFLGTELLLANGNKGQPCPQDGLTEYPPLDGTPYFACHHFATGHEH